MKQTLLKTWLMLVCLLVGVGSSWAEDMTIDFESATSTYSDWTFNNITSEQTTITAHGGSKHGQIASASGYIVTKNAIANPASITFYVSKSTNNTNSSDWKVQVSSNNSSWTDVKTQSATSMSKGTWVEVTQSLTAYNNVYVRVYYSGSTAVRCIDDLTLTTSASAVPAVALADVNLNFGNVVQNEEVSAKTIAASLSNTSSATVSLSGSGASAFSIDKTTLTESGNITVTPNTSVVGTFEATLTLSADGATPASKTISMTVEAPFTGTITTMSADNDADIKFVTGSSSTTGAVWANSTPLTANNITLSGSVTSGTNYSYYDGSVVRFYANNNIVITPSNGATITKVEIVRQSTTSSNSGTINCSGLTASNDNTTTNTNVYTGSTTSAVTFTNTAQARFTKILVYSTGGKTLQTVTVSGTPTKTTYTAGDSFEPAGLTVTGRYDDDSNETITKGITWSTPAALTAGQTSVSITATVNGVTSAAYNVTGLTVNAPITLSSISATGTPAEFWKGDAFNHDGITVTATWSDDTQTDVTSECSFSTPDMSTAGQKTVTVTYQGKTDTYDINVQTIANTQAEAYTVAQAKALIDAGKDLATQVYVAGTVSEIVTAWSDQYNNITYNISADGETTGQQFQLYRCATNGAAVGDDVVAYGTLSKHNETYEFAAGNTITKIEKQATLSIADITVANGEDITPVITTNIVGEYAIEYTSDNEEVVLADGDEMVTMGAGTATITATITADGYKTAETTFNVTVTTGATVTSVTLSGELTKTTYTIGDTFDHTGLVATANYSDDTHVDVTETATWEVDPEELTTAGSVTVTVSASFGGQEDIQEYEVTVNKKTASISFAPATIDVEVGKNITLAPTTTPADAVISYTITEGSENVSIDGAVVTGVAEGTATIRADYAGNVEYAPASTTVTINVIPADASTTVTQTGFDETSGNLVDDTNGEDANLSYEAFKGDAGTAPAINSSNLRLYQGGGYVTIKGAAGVTISQVKITTGSTYASTTVGYCVDDEDAPTTGESVAKNSDYIITNLNNQSVSIYCLGTDKNTRLDIAAIEVKYTKEDIELSSIALSGEYQTEFIQNQTFNHDGIVVTATFSNGQNEDVTARATFSDPDMTTAGTKTITVSYTDADVTKTAEYDITVAEEVVTAIALSGEYQTTFRVGDTFNHDNLVVKATYNSGRTDIDVTSEATVSTPDMSVAGEKNVTVSYGGQNANYTIKVLPANTIFYESFDTNDGTGGNDGQWSGSIASNSISSDNANWTFASSGGANKCARFGTGSNKGAATTPALGYEGVAIMTFKSAAWNGGSESLVVNLSVEGDGAISQSSITNKKGEWTEYTVTLTGLTAESKVKFEAANLSNNRFFLDEVIIKEAEDFDLTVSSVGYATLCLPYNATIPTGAAVYTGTYNKGSVTLNEVEGGKIKAGEGYIVKAEAGNYTFTITSDDVEAPAGNNLVGVTERTQLTANGSIYIFANQSQGVGFYKLGQNAYLGANKAYLQIPAGSSAREFVGFGDDTETAIKSIIAEPENDGKYLLNGKVVIIKNGVKYNVNGQRMR